MRVSFISQRMGLFSNKCVSENIPLNKVPEYRRDLDFPATVQARKTKKITFKTRFQSSTVKPA